MGSERSNEEKSDVSASLIKPVYSWPGTPHGECLSRARYDQAHSVSRFIAAVPPKTFGNLGKVLYSRMF
jgi:hypothetical protein